MVSVADGLRMMQGGVDRTGFADMADALGNPGLDLIRERRAAAAEAAAMDEFEKLMEGKDPKDPVTGGDDENNLEINETAMSQYGGASLLPLILGKAGAVASGLGTGALGIYDKFTSQIPMIDERLQEADPEGFEEMMEDPGEAFLYNVRPMFSLADGGRVKMQLGGGIMNALLGSSQVQNAFQQYRQPTMDFSQVASSSIPQQTVAPPTPAQAYTPFVSTMPLYDPSTLGTGLPSTVGMADPYAVYDPYSPVGAFDTPKARTTGFLSREQIDKGFADVDKYSLAKQREKRKAEEEAKKKKVKKPGGGGNGKDKRDRFMAQKGAGGGGGQAGQGGGAGN